MANEEVLYVVGMKTYDKEGNLIRHNYTFVSGPFIFENDAFNSAKEKIEELQQQYQCILKNDETFSTAEQGSSIELLQSSNNKIYRFLTLDIVPVPTKIPAMLKGSGVTASVKGIKTTNEDIIQKRLQRKAKQALTEISI